jgi:transcription antitermination factor NusG
VPILKREVDCSPPDLFELALDDHPWWAAYVRSRQEKRMARHLTGRGVGFYLPQAEKRVRRTGRTFVSALPLFPGYVFFRGGAAAKTEALASNLVVQLLPVVDQELLHQELHGLWRLQQAGVPLVSHPYLAAGDAVEIVDGPFRGARGTVLREKGRLRLVVSVSMLRRSVAAEIDREALAPLPADRRQRGQRGRHDSTRPAAHAAATN